MLSPLPPLRLTGALSLRDGSLKQRTVGLRGGRFTTGPLPALDMTGFYLMPGIVDLGAIRPECCDPDAHADLPLIDGEAARHGVTTRFLVLPWTWERPGATAGAARLARELALYRTSAMTDLRAQLVCERLMTTDADTLIDLVGDAEIDLVTFSDRAAHARVLRDTDAAAFDQHASSAGTDAEALRAALDVALRNAPRVPRHLCRLAETFDRMGVIYGSHGDATAECREHHSMIGARLCHDPGSAQVAAAAHAVGDPVIAAADDILRAPNGAARARSIALIQARLCDALASGRTSAAPVQAVFRLADLGILPLEHGWRLISGAPADILRLSDRGAIAPGKRADLTIINAATRQVEATICAGRLTFLTGEAIARFLAVDPAARFAAQWAARAS